MYAYNGHGGFSNAIPYAAGLAALAWSVDPDFSMEEILGLLIQTRTQNSSGKFVVNPLGFIEAVELRAQKAQQG